MDLLLFGLVTVPAGLFLWHGLGRHSASVRQTATWIGTQRSVLLPVDPDNGSQLLASQR